MYERFYGLRELPFELTPNPQYLFLTARHREALCNLQYGITARRGITLLIGEAGTGKTTLVHAALGLVSRDDARCVYLNNPTLTRAEFVEFLAHGFGLSEEAQPVEGRVSARTRARAPGRLTRRARVGAADRRGAEPSPRAAGGNPPAGQHGDGDRQAAAGGPRRPARAGRSSERAGASAAQTARGACGAISVRCSCTRRPRTFAARLERAGGRSAEIFTREAVETIHERSGGIPRTISVICDNALISGFAADRRPVDREDRARGVPRSRFWRGRMTQGRGACDIATHAAPASPRRRVDTVPPPPRAGRAPPRPPVDAECAGRRTVHLVRTSRPFSFF